MIMDLLRQLGMNFNKEKAHDAIDGTINDWEKSKRFTEEMMGGIPQETQDLLFNLITGGGIGGTLKTAGKAGRGIVNAMKRRGSAGKVAIKKAGTEDETLRALKENPYEYSEEGQGDFFKSLLDDLFESFKGKEF